MILLEHPYEFFISFFLLTIGFGIWLGHRLNHWRLERMKTRLELMKIELACSRPIRPRYL